jgi:hypothetical protein
MQKLAVVVALLIAVAALAIWVRSAPRTVDGVSCNVNASVRYHVHAHLTIVNAGRIYFPPAGIGLHYEHLCFYWLHTHAPSGIIHIEAPRRITPTLGTFFDIWGQPLSQHRVWRFTVDHGRQLRIFVDSSRFSGNPRSIELHDHTSVTLEIGPPFIPPPIPSFAGL